VDRSTAGRQAVDHRGGVNDETPGGRSRPSLSGGPLGELIVASFGPAPRCVVTTSDRAGRLADRSLMRDMGWCRLAGVRFDVQGDVILVRADASSVSSITTQGHLRLPLAVRRRGRIDAGTRLLLVAWPETGTLAICTMAGVAGMVLARLTGSGEGAGGRS
jgi:hypothetical protein